MKETFESDKAVTDESENLVATLSLAIDKGPPIG